MSHRFCILCILVFIVGLKIPVLAAGIDSQTRADDARLDKRVTLTEKRIDLSDLLRRLSAQSGVTLKIDDRETASGVHMMANFTDVPLGDVMDALWSLVSNREAQWSWLRGGKPGEFRYSLFEPIAARERSAHHRQYVQTAFENYAATMTAIANMTPEDRQRNKARITRALLQSDDQYTDALLKSEQTWRAIRLFAEATPPETLSQVLQGRRSAEISTSDLPEPARQLLHSLWAGYHASRVLPDGTSVALPEPSTLLFFTDNWQSAKHKQMPTEVAPSVCLSFGEDAGEVSILGGAFLQAGVRNVIKKQWLLKSDGIADAIAGRLVAPPVNPPKPPYRPPILAPDGSTVQRTASDPRVLQLRLAELSEGASVPVLAVLPYYQNGNLKAPANQTVGAFLEDMDNLRNSSVYPMHKWRSHMLLVSYPNWFIEEDKTVSHALTRLLRVSPDGLVPLANLAKFMSNISETQATSLAQEYSIVHSVLGLYPLFTLYAADPDLLRPQGIRLDKDRIALLRTIKRFSGEPSLVNGTAAAVRFTEHDTVTKDYKTRVADVEVLVSDVWHSIGSSIQTASLTR